MSDDNKTPGHLGYKTSTVGDIVYPPKHSEKDWTEDFSHENGNYVNQCCYCRSAFYGHKRRVICKECTSKPISEAPVKESPERGIMFKSVIDQSEQYANDMQNGDIRDGQLWIQEADLYLSVAKWQEQQRPNLKDENDALYIKISELESQSSNPNYIQKDKVISILEAEALKHGDCYFGDAIPKIKAL